MQYVVNASIENGTPQLKVIDLQSGQVRLRWKMEKIQEMFDTGEIKREEFLQPDKYGMGLLLKNLFLIACAQDLHQNCPYQNTVSHQSPGTTDDWQFIPRIGHMK